MLTKSPLALDQTFSALADPTRRAILKRLAAGEATVRELAEPFSISAPAISRHLRVLETAGLIARRVDKQHRRCSLQPHALQNAAEWLNCYRDFWHGSFDRLADHLKSSHSKRKTHGTPRTKAK